MTETQAELTTSECARLAGVDPSYIRRLLIDGTLRGRKIELAPGFGMWKVERASFDHWQQTRRRKRR